MHDFNVWLQLSVVKLYSIEVKYRKLCSTAIVSTLNMSYIWKTRYFVWSTILQWHRSGIALCLYIGGRHNCKTTGHPPPMRELGHPLGQDIGGVGQDSGGVAVA